MKSSLTTYTKLTQNHSGKRTKPIKHIVIHHMAGVMTGKQCADYFAITSRQVSSNYCIGYAGDVACSVLEQNRAWTSSSAWIDQQAITIEVSNSSYGEQWPVSQASLNATIRLIADICKRHGIEKCTYTGDKAGTLHKHSWYANTNCPGPYLGAKFDYIAQEVNKLLGVVETKPVTKKTNVEIAQEVLDGKWGNGTDRKNRLTQAGYDYNAVQAEVNKLVMKPKEQAKAKLLPLQEIAKEVIQGKWGNGQDRINRLNKAGYNATEVQKKVNELLTPKAQAMKPKTKPLVVGSTIKIKTSAKTYATGQRIPLWVKGKTDTVIQIKTDRVLLRGIYSWVKKEDVEVV